MKNILIATPSYDGKIDVWYANALYHTSLMGLQQELLFNPVFMSYDALVQRSRNDLLAIAVEQNFDGVLWIDADIEWHPQWAIDVVTAGVDVLGLPVIKKSATDESYNVKCKIENLVQDERGLIEVESVGTGFLYMSRDAFVALWETGVPYVHNEQHKRWAFEVRIQDGDIISEDVLACQKLRDVGYKIYIDPSKTCNHIGALKFSGNFVSFIERIK